jgi:predicted CoA-binding protein
MTHKNPTDNELRALLNSARTIAVVGASSKPGRPSNEITRILIDARFDVIPVTPNETQVHGRRAYSSLADVPRPIDIVDVFRNADSALGLAKEAVQVGAGVFWLQLA